MIFSRRFLPALGGAALAFALAVSACAQPAEGYLNPEERPNVAAWLPAEPTAGSAAEKADFEAFFASRALASGPEGERAQMDDAYPPERVAPRFADALGVSLDAATAPTFMRMMSRVTLDIETEVAPVKVSRTEGGRVRPFVRFPGQPGCDARYPGLADTGSYPSTHAALGWLWGSILAEMEPDISDRLIARGLQYGDSRMICGFHYASDVTAGRLAAAVLMVRLHADPEFRADFRKAKQEVDAARGLRRSRSGFTLPRLFRPRG